MCAKARLQICNLMQSTNHNNNNINMNDVDECYSVGRSFPSQT